MIETFTLLHSSALILFWGAGGVYVFLYFENRDVALGQPVVLACSALKKMYRDILIRGGSDVPLKSDDSVKEEPLAGRKLLVVYLCGSFDVIYGRLLQRKGHFMPPELLQSQFSILEPPSAPENFIQVSVDRGLPEITAAIMEALK